MLWKGRKEGKTSPCYICRNHFRTLFRFANGKQFSAWTRFPCCLWPPIIRATTAYPDPRNFLYHLRSATHTQKKGTEWMWPIVILNRHTVLGRCRRRGPLLSATLTYPFPAVPGFVVLLLLCPIISPFRSISLWAKFPMSCGRLAFVDAWNRRRPTIARLL